MRPSARSRAYGRASSAQRLSRARAVPGIDPHRDAARPHAGRPDFGRATADGIPTNAADHRHAADRTRHARSAGMRRAAGDLYELAIPPPDPRLSNADLAPTTHRTAHVDDLPRGLAVGRPLGLHSRPTCSPPSLVGAGMDWKQAIFTIMLGNLIVLRADGARRARGNAVRHPVPGARAIVVRHPRLERARAHAVGRGVRLVRHPDLDRRPGDLHDAEGRDPQLGAAVRDGARASSCSGS